MAYVFKVFVDGCKNKHQKRIHSKITSKAYQRLKEDFINYLTGTVVVKNLATGKTHRMSTEEYAKCEDTNIKGTTYGQVTVIDNNTGKTFNISKEDYESRPDHITSAFKGYTNVKNTITNEIYKITIKEFKSPDRPNHIVAANKGNIISEESRKKMRKPRSEQGKQNIKDGMKPWDDERRKKLAQIRNEANKKNRVCCLKTKKEYDLPNFKRWCV